jgi:hypothetical protein
MRPPTSTDTVASTIGIGSVVLLAVAASGATAEIGTGRRQPPDAMLVVAEWFGAFLALGIAAFGVVLVGLLRSARRRRRADDEFEKYIEPRKLPRAWAIALAFLAAAGVAAAVLLALLSTSQSPPRFTAPSLPSRSTSPPLGRPAQPSPPHLPPFPWGWFAAVAIVLGASIGVVALVARQRSGSRPDRETRRLVDADVDETSLARLARDAEPRLAVRLAYAFMRRTLNARGLVSTDTDAPREYALRAGTLAPDLADPVWEVTALYERARFSSLDVDDDAKRRALESVRQLEPEAQP